MNELRISSIKKLSRVEGPGLRYVIWVQGCPIRCPGCFNPHTWDELGGDLMTVDSIFSDIKDTFEKNPDLKGVTFLGGEPFSQAKGLVFLAQKIKTLGLSIVTFSGYTYEKLLASNNECDQQLLAVTDLLIDGPYLQAQQDLSRPWIGSKNQQYRFLTDVYNETDILKVKNKLEIQIKQDGTVWLNGMATTVALEALKRLVE